MGASLVVLAAGMGSRYGGLKQIETFGPNGESLLEFAVYDALQAGFDHIIFVIRETFADAFREKFTQMLMACPRYDIVYQEVDPDFTHLGVEKEREKPRGTLHATLAATSVIDQPFAVVNADDRYGTRSYAQIYGALQALSSDQALLVGYQLDNTLSRHGTVNRGVCAVTDDAHLQDVKEHYAIGYDMDGAIIDKSGHEFRGKEIVSMNFWGFHPHFLEQVVPLFETFVRAHADDPRAEMVIPDGVDILIKQEHLTCRVLPSSDSRQGVTNPEDTPKVREAFQTMFENNIYPNSLWKKE